VFQGLSSAVRFLSIFQVANANSGHLGISLGMADCLTVLFRNFLVFDPKNPQWPNRDRFVLSAGHGSTMLYSILYLTGYENMTLDNLKNFRRLGSRATGHPEYDQTCGIEVTTGLLGQGLANAVGMAIEEKMLNARLGSDCINHYTYVCVSDGDLMEGIAHEASAIAGHLLLGKLIVLFDDNSVTIDGDTDISCSEIILDRYKSYEWHVSSINGHSERSIIDAIAEARDDPRPSIIACKTRIGLGSPRENSFKAHSGPFTAQEIAETRNFFHWQYAPFEVPEYIEKTWQVIGRRHHEDCDNWNKTQSHKFGALEFEFTSEMRKAFREIKKEYFVSRPFAATRKSSKEIISKIMEVSDFVVSGSADLGESTGCLLKNMKPISKDDFSGNYIHYGVREHAMGSIMNGIAAGGKIKIFAGTFLAFSDYMRPSIRMSAIMNIPTIFVFSHDSIGVGEDGPTHQPVEHLASLRAIPNLKVFRPADAMETLECWECAIKNKGPSVLILTRQDLLSVRFCGRTNLCENGGYLLYEDSSENTKRVTLIATGSEVSIALEVKKMLNDEGVSANIVSLPCWELFDEQPDTYRRHVLGNDLRIGVEASNGFGWEKYIGSDGIFCGVNNYGKSGSCAENYEFFGLTAKNIFDKIQKAL
jgi:transketolase